ncbi:LysR family transcriptional regulator [Streptococcus merionis]|uniref:LysR family transcriptional regulator n=1 Tax=Streptococcus merionis TaxID=400065 RepID=A0A239SS38_9STRE|nr:LysR family transcriptional regulator [Streptococcus merionis]SNU88176.1 LysR family transcriptional regulator [Streptococcus merionis]
MDLEHLRQLIAFAEYGTLSRTAEKLLLSQPALTRNMQRLEADLGVTLFHRKKNKLSLTETGQLAVKQGQMLLEHIQAYQAQLQNFENHRTKLYIGVCAPGPIYELRDIWEQKKLPQEFETEIREQDSLVKGLLDKTYQIIVTDQVIEKSDVISQIFFKEQLHLSIPTNHPLADRKSIALRELNHLTMLLRADLGIWDRLVDSLRQTTFIRQSDSETFDSLVQASNLPHFTTNITQLYGKLPENRIHIPITDSQATVTFYLNVLKENQRLLELILE